jgi:LEA14-like dessication related protein
MRIYRLLFPLVLPALLSCTSAGTRVQAPYVTLASIEVIGITLFEQHYQVRMRIQNPNDFHMPISGMSYELYINDRRFARGVSDVSVSVPRFGETMVTVGMVSDLGSVLDSFETRESRAGRGYNVFRYRLNGSIRLSDRPLRDLFRTSAPPSGSVPFEYEGEFNLKQAL